MTTDEGTPKRRRGLFRRDRGTAAATADERRGADAFDDPWSASAWDDWDDDFTNGGARSSVPPAAAPRPEAVDAWLQSEADDFDTATRRNTKKWGGDANRPLDSATGGLRSLRAEAEPTESNATVIVPGGLGLGALRESESSGSPQLAPTVPDVAETGANAPDTDGPDHKAADWASDPDHVPADELTVRDDVTVTAHAAVDDALENAVDDALDEISALPDETLPDAVDDAPDEISTLPDETLPDAVDDAPDEPISPIWEPVATVARELPDTPSPGTTDKLSTGTIDATIDETVDAAIDDELVFSDAIEPDQLELDDLAALDEEPETPIPPRAGWAPILDRPADPGSPAPTDELSSSGNDPVRNDFAESTATPVSGIIADTPDDETFVGAQEVRIRLPGLANPVPPQQPPSRFVTVSVVSDDDQGDIVPALRLPTTAPSVVGVEAGPADRNGAQPPLTTEAAGATPQRTPPSVDTTAPAAKPSSDASGPNDGAAPKITSRRWAALAAEFGSDGDLDDSFPSRRRAGTPPSTAVEPFPTVGDDTEPHSAGVGEPVTDRGAVVVGDDTDAHSVGVVEPVTDLAVADPTVDHGVDHGVDLVEPINDAEPATADPRTVDAGLDAAVSTTTDYESMAEGARTIDASAAPEQVNATPERDADPKGPTDPWAQPPVRGARPDASVSGPPTTRKRAASRTSTEDDPWTRPPQRPERPERPAASVRAARPGSPGVAADSPGERRPQRPVPAPPSPDRPSLSQTLEPANVVHDEVSPDISTFAGYIGTALVGFAIVRIILTLVGDQPVIPARYTGREAGLLRIGESFGSSGSAWPVALVVGTVLLTVPSFLAFRSHLRRWAPVVGLAAATGIVAIAIGALRLVAGRRLGSASTVKLISDVVVGPIGFGLLTLVAVGLAIRSHRR